MFYLYYWQSYGWMNIQNVPSATKRIPKNRPPLMLYKCVIQVSAICLFWCITNDNRIRSAWNSWRGLSGVIWDKKVLSWRTNYTKLSSDLLWYMAVSVACYTEQSSKGCTQDTTEMKMDSGQNKERQNQKWKVQERCNGQANHHICHPETPFLVWPCVEKRRYERC